MNNVTYEYQNKIYTATQINAHISDDIVNIREAQIVSLINQRIVVLKPEIAIEGGTVNFKLDWSGVDIVTKNLSSELAHKIEKAILSSI